VASIVEAVAASTAEVSTGEVSVSWAATYTATATITDTATAMDMATGTESLPVTMSALSSANV
jgi:hypothetical protein